VNANARKKILVILPRGESIRNFLYTGALELLAKDHDLALLSVFPNADLAARLRALTDEIAELRPFVNKFLPYWIRLLLYDAHDRTNWTRASQDHWRRRRDRSRLRWVNLVLSRLLANQPGLRLLSLIERKVSFWTRPDNFYLDLIRTWRPDVVFNGSHIHSENAMQAVLAARECGIPTAAFFFSWDNLTSRSRIVPGYDHYLVWNSGLKQGLLDLYPEIAAGNVFITGTPQFDLHFSTAHYWTREAFCRRCGADPERPILFYATGMPKHMLQEPHVLADIADLLGELPLPRRPQLLVRLYPKYPVEGFAHLRERADIIFLESSWEQAFHTPLEDDLVLYINALRHADAGVNIASTVSLECCMFDKPVINPAYIPAGGSPETHDYGRFYEYAHYRPIVASGAVQVAYTREEMARYLIEAFTEPAKYAPERRALIEGFFESYLDGQSFARVAAALDRILAGARGSWQQGRFRRTGAVRLEGQSGGH